LRLVNEESLHRVEVDVHTQHRVGPIDERIFGGFLEHLGRAVYEGVFDPANPLSDDRGFREDVLDALRPLRMPVVRYPGGNFVSTYRWRDGVGPLAERPRRPDFAWRSLETNQFGTDEFIAWCDALGTRPMMAVNLGTGSPAGAAELVEYCNLPPGTSVADLRAANGHAEPYGVELWCLGNEMDGPWQAGHVPAQTYAERALVASALMKGLDPGIETIACGSSHRLMPSYLVWDRTVLEHCWDQIDYLSAHRYSGNGEDDTASYLAEGVVIDETISDYRGLFDYVRAIKRSRHRVHLSFDEWNVWYRERGLDGGWQEAPHLLEEVYNLEDALVCAQYLHAFVRHADVVKIACLAQIVNVIAPVLTRPDGILVQSIYWPFALLRDAVSGEALRVAVRSPELATRTGDVPVVDVAATYDEAAGRGCVSVVHRDPDRGADAVIRIADRRVSVIDCQILHAHPKASNGWADPHAVRPQPLATAIDDDGALRVRLAAPSQAVVRFATGT
jgi:alpha-N-arabinofuranosidase